MKYYILVLLFLSACAVETKDDERKDISFTKDTGTTEKDQATHTPDVGRKDDATQECSKSEMCAINKYCEESSHHCVVGCRDKSGCKEGQICDEGQCKCNAESCPEGEFCDTTWSCEKVKNCSDIKCDAEEYCDVLTFKCEPQCTKGSCSDAEFCNSEKRCVASTCPGNPDRCQGTVKSKWDSEKCVCVQCRADADCDLGKGEACNAVGVCTKCETKCTQANNAICGSDYCVNSCCVECVSKSDCNGGDFCLKSGTCGPLPTCENDPDVCPGGTLCKKDKCVPTGRSCDSNNPCPAPEHCVNSVCENPNGNGCGLCENGPNNTCVCPGGNTCSDLGCSCSQQSPDCPTGSTCLVALQLCLPD